MSLTKLPLFLKTELGLVLDEMSFNVINNFTLGHLITLCNQVLPYLRLLCFSQVFTTDKLLEATRHATIEFLRNKIKFGE